MGIKKRRIIILIELREEKLSQEEKWEICESLINAGIISTKKSAAHMKMRVWNGGGMDG